jgi:hypothetical protein
MDPAGLFASAMVIFSTDEVEDTLPELPYAMTKTMLLDQQTQMTTVMGTLL